MNKINLPAEWHPQKCIQLTWPHADSDWVYLLDEVELCFANIAFEVMKREKLIIVCQNPEHVKTVLSEKIQSEGKPKTISPEIYKITSNDTWARDHGGITVSENGKTMIYDFCFNGWGMKFPASHDNQITRRLFRQEAFEGYGYTNMKFFTLEGGSIESDGKRTILTTENCLLSPNRNDSLTKNEIESCLKKFFGAERILWLKNGHLTGDDTDSHIDTLARFCDENTIAYVKCYDRDDEHFNGLQMMEDELKAFRQRNGEPYNLVPLPLPTPVFDRDDGHRLPATYANFLIMNDVVLFPVYNVETDKEALNAIQTAFPGREIVPVDCSVLIRQHGSLHCLTMQYPQMQLS
ncbi:MAG: agmatine deiminase family protein [Prolixibacteraceae bacterium]|nr:agmatine deiminase family protein [Prolixibacteraceae bacterium]